MKNFVKQIEHVTTELPRPVYAGSFVQIGRCFGVAIADSAGETNQTVLVTKGVFELPVAGNPQIYQPCFATPEGDLTATATDVNREIGYFLSDSLESGPSRKALVRIDG